MIEYFRTIEEDGLYKIILPVFDDSQWQDVVPSHGFVWITRPYIDFTKQLESIVRSKLRVSSATDLRYSIFEVDLDVSLPSCDFLDIVAQQFPRGINLAFSKKHQPPNLRLVNIPKRKWKSVMNDNQIEFLLHRPDGGEPSLVTSCNISAVQAMISRIQK